MKAGDLVTPTKDCGLTGDCYFRLWADYTGQTNPQVVNDRFFLGEVGIVLDFRDHAGYGMVLVLSPRGRSGWLSNTNLDVCSANLPSDGIE